MRPDGYGVVRLLSSLDTEYGTRIKNHLSKYIKSKRALYGAVKAVLVSMIIDEPYYPVTIEELGLERSVWIKENPSSLGLVLKLYENRLMNKFKEFEKYMALYGKEILEKCRKRAGRRLRRVNRLGLTFECVSVLEEYGFEPLWIDYWAPLIPVEDIAGFSIVTMLHYIYKNGQIRIELYDPNVSYIPIWRRSEGLLDISEEEIKRILSHDFNY